MLWQMPKFRPVSLMNHFRGVFGLNLGRLWTEAAKLDSLITLMIGEWAEGRLLPIVAQTFPLAEAAAAHRFLHDRRNIGKVVLTM
jgi:NADPH:quinone reductase-like Zn-dependent oxidoreductase